MPRGYADRECVHYIPTGATASELPADTLEQLRVLARADGEDVSSDALPNRGHEYYEASDYALAADPARVTGSEGLPLLFIASPKDVVVATPRDADDHVQWALDDGDYERRVRRRLRGRRRGCRRFIASNGGRNGPD